MLIGDEAPPPPPPPPPPAADSAPSSEPPTGGAAAAAAEPDAPVAAVGRRARRPIWGRRRRASVAENEVHVKSEGQGLSAKQKRDAAALVQKALAAAAESADGLYSDPDFPPDASSLWLDGQAPGKALQQAGVGADLVAGWARPSAFPAPDDGGGGGGGGARVSSTPSGACRASSRRPPQPLAPRGVQHRRRRRRDPRARLRRHDARGQGLLRRRFFVDDPASDDDWVVVLVDDRLPVGADGAPCFGRCPTARVLWVPNIEKAFAKYTGCNEATSGGSVEDGLLYLTGGMAREVGVTPSADPSLVDALWAQMMEWWMSAHVIGCEHRTDAEPTAELLATGLLPNTPYAVTGGEPAGAGRMVRLRTFHGYSEWKGKWCDTDPAWTSRLRQPRLRERRRRRHVLDGLRRLRHLVQRPLHLPNGRRPLDDPHDQVALGGRHRRRLAAQLSTWRCNPMWLLRTTSELRVTVTLSIPQPPPPAGGANVPLFAPESAISLSVITCNGGADTRRRKLQIVAPEELVVRAEPRPVRRLVRHLTLPGSEAPYLLVPHTYMPGVESPFTMTVRADDVDDDGNADFTLEPIRPRRTGTRRRRSSRGRRTSPCARPPTAAATTTTTTTPAPAPAAPAARRDRPGSSTTPRSHCTSRRAAASTSPSIRSASRPTGASRRAAPTTGPAATRRWASLSSPTPPPLRTASRARGAARAQGAVSDDSCCSRATPGVRHAVHRRGRTCRTTRARRRHPLLGCRVWVYADAPFSLSDAEQAATAVQHGLTSEGKCICWGLGNYPSKQNEGTCIVLKVYNSLKKMEQGLDRQLKYLDGLAPHATPDYM